MCTGWTWEYCQNDMDLPRLLAMNSYWKANPPLHLLVRAFVGFEGGQDEPQQPEQDLDELLAAFPMG